MNKFPIILLLALFTLSVFGNSQGAEQAEKIHINADHMQANIKTGISIYTGNVKVKQGKLYLTGDRIDVTQSNNEVEEIMVTGKPAHYYHVTEDGEVIEANSEKMVYTASKNLLVLTINARLNHPEHKISSQKIVYNTFTKVAVAGDKQAPVKTGSEERVKITLTPKPKAAEDMAVDDRNSEQKTVNKQAEESETVEQ